MTNHFSSLGIRDTLCEALQHAGLSVPTPVQAQTIPAALSGDDVIVQAQTGTGKTLAFLLPLLHHSGPQHEFIRALVLTPTRELAIQIAAEARKLADAVGAKVMSVYGGQDVIAQVHKLGTTPDLIIATPGRLLDHLRRGTIDLSRLSALVLDEADQMLHMGFLPEVEEVIRQTPDDRQTMLFSATFPESVRVLSEKYMNRPKDIRIQGKRIILDEIRQYVVETTERQKKAALIGLLAQNRPYLAVIFCRTKIRAKKLTESLLAEGLNVDELHGDLTQAKREAVMQRFRSAELQLLVATDVAARGLDVEGVTHVYNYDIPHDSESYIHRIGRTGRAGQQGTAITLVAPKDEGDLREIERAIGSVLERITVRPERTNIGDSTAESRRSDAGGAGHVRQGKRWQGRASDDRAKVGGLAGKRGISRTEHGAGGRASGGEPQTGRSRYDNEQLPRSRKSRSELTNTANRHSRHTDDLQSEKRQPGSKAGDREGKDRQSRSRSSNGGDARVGGRNRDAIKPFSREGGAKSGKSRKEQRKAGPGQNSRPRRPGGR